MIETPHSETSKQLFKCNECGVSQPADSFYVKKDRISLTWCKSCYREWHRNRYKPKSDAHDESRLCVYCKKEYRPKARRPSTFCSRECKNLFRRAKQKAERVASKPTDRRCIHCGKSMPQLMRTDAAFCSEKCNSASHNLMRKHAFRTQAPKRSRSTFRALVAEHDEWVCGICNKPVDPNVKHPDPKYGSIDHIIPISMGGSSDNGNLQLAHLVCNLRKGGSIPAEIT